MYYVFYIPASSFAKFCSIINSSSLIFKFFLTFLAISVKPHKRKARERQQCRMVKLATEALLMWDVTKQKFFWLVEIKMSVELLNSFQAGYLNTIFLSTDPWQHEKREDLRHLLRIDAEGEGKFLLLL